MYNGIISVITATYNSACLLPDLIASLRAQTDSGFEWVVVDGASTDTTVAVVREAGLPRQVLVSEPDFGIYDALNKGLRASSGDYYLVLGSDDVLSADAIANFRQALEGGGPAPDMVSACVMSGGARSVARVGKGWLYGLRGFVSQHSVGVLIRKGLHDEVGLYSRRFAIAADQLFIKRAARAGAVIKYCDFVAGNYGSVGVSSVDTAGTLTEFFRVQLLTEDNRFLQVVLFIARLLKNYRRL